MSTEKRRETIKRILGNRRTDFAIVVENIHDKHNIGAVARTYDCVGGLDLFIINTNKIDLRSWYTTSRRADRWLRIHIYDDVGACFAELKRRGFTILAGDSAANSKDLYDIDFVSERIALVFGEEHAGISEKVRELADGVFTIPQVGASQSLNISVAAAVSMYEAYRQKRAAGQDGATLSKEQYDFLLERWSAVEPRNRTVVIRHTSVDG